LISSNKPQLELCRRPAVKRKRNSAYPTPESGPSPLSSCSKALPERSESEYSRCPLCDFRPSGEPRWFKRTLARHMGTHLAGDEKKVHHCVYDGCDKSFTRSDNLAQHVRLSHQRNKRQSNSEVASYSQEFLDVPGLLILGDSNMSPKRYKRASS
jgi:hypothetical protein